MFKIQGNSRIGFFLAAAIGLPFYVEAAPPGSADALPTLRPPHAEISLSFWEHYGWALIVVGLIMAASAATLAWLLTRPAPQVIVPPEEEARRALAALPTDAVDGAALSRISRILRHYVRRAFGLPMAELTTAEFCQLLASHPLIGGALAQSLVKFFQENDFHKFSTARSQPLAVSPIPQALALIDQCESRRAELRAAQAVNTPPTAKPA